jgi:SAM-dependent methyltransferase
MTGCPVCGRRAGSPFLEIEEVPAFCNVLWPSAEDARSAATGRISLRACASCDMVWNSAFDPDVVAYAPGYENALHFSAVFRHFAEELAERLVERHGLEDKDIVDIGCGTGEFLTLLCAGGRNRGVGYDPSLEGTPALDVSGNVRFVADVYSGSEAGAAPDFVSCRHVLEHVDDPLRFLCELRATLDDGGETVLYFEVPAGDSMLRNAAVWDVIYEHPSYFTAPALRALFERAGFRVLELGWSFGDQYLWIEAAPDAEKPRTHASGSAKSVQDALAPFSAAFRSKVRSWDVELERCLDDGGVAVWGAGSKGVTFVNVVPAARDVALVVDVSPRKHDRHVPRTGQRVVSPEALSRRPVRTIVAMNPLYRTEIERTLASLDVEAEVVPA